MKGLKILQTALLILLTAAALTIVVQNQMLLKKLSDQTRVDPRAISARFNAPPKEVLDVRIVDVKEEIPVNIEEINGFNIFGTKLPVSEE